MSLSLARCRAPRKLSLLMVLISFIIGMGAPLLPARAASAVTAVTAVTASATTLSADDHAIFREVSSQVGLPLVSASRVAAVDVNGDGRPDLVVEKRMVFLNRVDPESSAGFRFDLIESGLEPPAEGVSVFVDVDGDGIPDAIEFRSMDAAAAAREGDAAKPCAWWQRGRGDGTFEPRRPIDAATPATASAIGAGDVDRDGRTDLLVGNWYTAYGKSVEAFPAELLLNREGADGSTEFVRAALPEDSQVFDEEHDLAGRPVYGAMIAQLLPAPGWRPPQLIELCYGRRWNRLYARTNEESAAWRDVAPQTGFDGDADRSGRYPDWLRERAKTDSRFPSEDEKPFRSNGNTFDAAIGDVNNDGLFDLFVAEITHEWAGPSADRSRFLIARRAADGFSFVTPPEYSVDRLPPGGVGSDGNRWNQGDLFAELADFDHDGRLDLLLGSGDYPDPPPRDQRLRLFHQRSEPGDDGRLFEDVTAGAGVDQPGCGQIAVADFDLDGRMDIVAGQSFTRFTPEMIARNGGVPRIRLWLNRTGGVAPPPSIELRLHGDPARGMARIPLGTVVRVECDVPGAAAHQMRQLMGPGGHAGKESEAIIHFGLGGATRARLIEITWPCTPPRVSELHDLPAGRYDLSFPPPGSSP